VKKKKREEGKLKTSSPLPSLFFPSNFSEFAGGNFLRPDSTESLVVVESGAGDFWIDQSEFLLVGDWI
jgi:hypothetical protein